MAFATLFTLLDDITSTMDDAASLTKVTTKNSADAIDDDLILNIYRELPTLRTVAIGSLINKLILIPAALLLSWLAPWSMIPLLIIGAAYLCFEGMEKILRPLPHKTASVSDGLMTDKPAKITGAIRTDFILSAEIIVIALVIAGGSSLPFRALFITAVGLGMTVFVYGLAALIVKLDELGLRMIKKGGLSHTTGRLLITAMPWLMRSFSLLGMVTIFLIGGEVISHDIPFIGHFLHEHHWHNGPIGMFIKLAAGLATGAIAWAVARSLPSLFCKKEAH